MYRRILNQDQRHLILRLEVARAAHDRDRPFRQARRIALTILGKLNDQLGDRSRRRVVTIHNDLALLVVILAWPWWRRQCRTLVKIAHRSLRVRQGVRDQGITRWRHHEVMASGHDDQILLTILLIDDRRGLAAGGEHVTPQDLAGLDVESAYRKELRNVCPPPARNYRAGGRARLA